MQEWLKNGGSIKGANVCEQDQYAKRLEDVYGRLVRPLQPLRSLRRRAKAERSGLSCMLLPFFPRRPQRVDNAPSSSVKPRFPESSLLCDPFLSPEVCLEVPPPNMADTDECAHRACLRMADVTVIHSVTTSATGSMATVAGLELANMVGSLLMLRSGRLTPLFIVVLFKSLHSPVVVLRADDCCDGPGYIVS